MVRFIKANLLFGMVIILAFHLWRVRQNFEAEQARSKELQHRLTVAHLETLQMQLNPHFLFNTLQTLTSLISLQPATATRMVVSLGDFFQRTLKERSSCVRRMAEELEFVNLYLSIEKLRLGERLVLSYDVDPIVLDAEVPSFLLQPLFENAVRHGVARLSTAGKIDFRAWRDSREYLNISIENDGLVDSGAETLPRSGIGLANTKDRLQIQYGAEFSFQFHKRPRGGVLIEISFPYREVGNNGVATRAVEAHSGSARRGRAVQPSVST